MIEHLFIAEKSSLAGEVAEARAQQLGVKATKGRTHWTVGPDAVTWLAGHMYEPAPPQAYGERYAKWSLQDLPIVPDRWKLVADKQKVDRVREVQDLLKQSRKVVNVGDPGREGQLLVDELLVEAKRDPFGSDVFRLWITDLAPSKKVEALKAMFPNADKKTLYESALCRQRADWLHGMNMTRLYTTLARRSGAQIDKPLSVGRVQTPTLRIVVDRDREIENFKPVDHFLPTGTFRHANGSFRATWVIPPDHAGLDSEGRLVDKAVADAVAAKVAGKTGAVVSHEVKKKIKAPPLAYSLTALEKDCSAKFGFTVEQTDTIAQALYETHKVASYPRTDCRHLPTGVLAEEVPTILSNLGATRAYGTLVANADPRRRSAVWDDAKVAASDAGHYAIMPTMEATEAKLAALSPDERKVFDLVTKAFLANFYPDHRWDSTTILVEVERERFKATGRRVTDQGWKVVYGEVEKEEDEDEDEQSLPLTARGDPVTAEKTSVDSKRTSPPARFTEGTLVEAMENIHKFVPEGEIKKKLRANAGIGTSATRGPTIKILKGRLFLTPKGKFIVSTPLGRSLVDSLEEKHKDPALTALWEDQIAKVNKGELAMDRFLTVLVGDIEKTVARMSTMTLKIAAGGPPPVPGHGKPCPKCGKGTMLSRTGMKEPNKGKRFLSCDAYDKDDPASCRHAEWPDDRKPVEKLPEDGAACPGCGKGRLVTRAIQKKGPDQGKRFLSCDAWKKDDPSSCTFVKWPEDERKPVPKLDGDGNVCPQCGKGRLATRAVMRGERKGARFLACDGWKKDDPSSCTYSAWEQPKVEPLPGHGDPCPDCRTGTLQTRMVNKGDHRGKRYLVCDKGRRDDPTSCKHIQWPKTSVEPMPGHGETCPACRNGKMVTRMLNAGEQKGKRYLSCDAYDKDDPRSCRHRIWPADDRAVRGVGLVRDAEPRKGSAKAGTRAGSRRSA